MRAIRICRVIAPAGVRTARSLRSLAYVHVLLAGDAVADSQLEQRIVLDHLRPDFVALVRQQLHDGPWKVVASLAHVGRLHVATQEGHREARLPAIAVARFGISHGDRLPQAAVALPHLTRYLLILHEDVALTRSNLKRRRISVQDEVCVVRFSGWRPGADFGHIRHHLVN